MLRLFTITLLTVVVACTAPTASSDQANSANQDTITADAPALASPFLRSPQILSYAQQAAPITRPAVLPPPFDSLPFDRVVAYDFNERRRPFSTALNIEAQRYSSDITKQQALSSVQVERLTSFLGSQDSYGGITAACFDPRLAFVFYQGKQATLVVDICLDCNFLQSTTEIPATLAHSTPLEGGDSYPLRGFSRSGREQVIKLAAALKLFYGQLGPEDYEYSIGE